MTKVEGLEENSEGDDDSLENSDDDVGPNDGDQNKRDENSSEEEYKADEDFIDPDDIIIKTNDLEQVLKGYRVEQVGSVNALGHKYQLDLEIREDIDRSDSEDENADSTAPVEKKNNFFAIQRAEMVKNDNMRDDKHLLPKPFPVARGEKQPTCEYGEIDLIFNHKNIWANL